MAKNLFKRYIWLVDTIYRARKINFEGINTKWLESSLSDGNPYPKKTFDNHKKAIEDIFDIIIECDMRDGYKYYIENSDDLRKGNFKEWLLNSFTLNNLVAESQKLIDRIQLEDVPSGQQHLSSMLEAMKNSCCIAMTYQSYWRDSANEIQIEPFFLKIFKQRWYIVAYSREKQAMRTYALDRIQKLSITQTKFKYPKDFSPSEYFHDSYGIINGDEIAPCTVRIMATAHQAKYIRDLPLHHSQKEIEKNAGMTIFGYYIKPSFDFRKELLSMGAEVEILEPEWFKEEIKREINEMNNKYK